MRLTRLFTTDYFFYDCNKLDKLFHKPTATPPKVHSLPCLEQIKGKLVQCVLHSIWTKKTLFIVNDKASVYCNLSMLTGQIKRFKNPSESACAMAITVQLHRQI